MGRRLPILVKVLACQLLLSMLLTSACNELEFPGDLDASTNNQAGNGAATGMCPPGFDCARPCSTNADCDGKRGRTCGAFMAVARPPVLDAPSRTDRQLFQEDAGDEPVSPTDAGAARPPSIGLCTSTCNTNACDPGMVCSSSTGACRDGCDELRPGQCSADEFCNFAQGKCFPNDGSCERDSDCPRFNDALMARGTVSCTLNICRFEPRFGEGSASKLASPMPNEGLLPITVHQPSMGQRITNMDTFVFQFNIRAEVMVVSILLKSDFADLTDASNAALWIAYLDRAKARAGVSIRDGGAVRDGKWVAETPRLPLDQPLFFLALGYDEGRLVAQSDAIPFMIGLPLPRPGDPCLPMQEGMFCDEGSALYCIEGSCRTPCLSDEDCAAEGLDCLPLGSFNVSARVCDAK